MGKASRRKWQYAEATPLPSITHSALSQSPPRQVKRITPPGNFLKHNEVLTIIFSFLVAAMVIAGPVFLRLAALTFGRETTALPDLLGTARTLKGRTTTFLKVSFTSGDGETVTRSFPVGLGGAEAFSRDHPVIADVRVVYIPGIPWISGLVDDFGHSRVMSIIMASVFSGLFALIGAAHLIVVAWIEPRQRSLLIHGTPVPFESHGSFLASTRISYQMDGKAYRTRVKDAKIWSAVKFKEGKVVIVDPRNPKRFLIYGDGPYRVDS
jgi:hypothetical protein